MDVEMERKELALTQTDEMAKQFDLVQRKAKLYTASELVPTIYRGGTATAIANCVIALNIAQRIGADELMVMQNLYVINGRPSWSSQFVISALNSCRRFSPLKFEMKELGPKNVKGIQINDKECRATAIDLSTNEKLMGPRVSIEMAVLEGWYQKSGSKWQTMPDLMLCYRAAAFFGRLYAPELLNGLGTKEEAEDLISVGKTIVPEDHVNLAEASQEQPPMSNSSSMNNSSPETKSEISAGEIWSKLIDLAHNASISETAKAEIKKASEAGLQDVEKLQELLNKVQDSVLEIF
jgi:hypothetical protein